MFGERNCDAYTQARRSIFSHDRSVMHLHCALGDRQPHPGSAAVRIARILYPKERIEDTRDRSLGNTRTKVADRDDPSRSFSAIDT